MSGGARGLANKQTNKKKKKDCEKADLVGRSAGVMGDAPFCSCVASPFCGGFLDFYFYFSFSFFFFFKIAMNGSTIHAILWRSRDLYFHLNDVTFPANRFTCPVCLPFFPSSSWIIIIHHSSFIILRSLNGHPLASEEKEE